MIEGANTKLGVNYRLINSVSLGVGEKTVLFMRVTIVLMVEFYNVNFVTVFFNPHKVSIV